MERLVNFRDNQEQQADDHNNLQAYVRESFDDLVFDAIENNKAYAGFDSTATATTEVTSQPGRLYTNGAVHIQLDAVKTELFTYLPTVTKKKVVLVTWASETGELQVEGRDFLINVDTGETQPKSVPMESRRVANVSPRAGVESPDPQLPPIADTELAFAIVTLNPNGIESVEMVAENRRPRLSDVADQLKLIIDWKEITEPRITTIASDITNLANQVNGVANNRDLFNLFADVARLKEIAELPDDYAAYGADRFLTTDESDTTNVNFLAKVEEGIRFSDANAGLSELNVFSAFDPNQSITNGLLLPAYDNVTRLNITGYSGEVSISQYGYQTVSVVQKMMSRQRIRYGTTYTYCTNSAWWRSGSYDPVTHIFTRNGETFLVLSGDTSKNHQMIRLEQFWVDTYEEPYWDYVVNNLSITGALVAQSFLNSQDGWLTQIGFYLTRKAANGNITLTIVETTNGAPDLTKAVMSTTVDYTKLKLYPAQTLVDVPPTYLKAGTRYALVITTNANHWIAMASGNSYAQGTFFYSTDGAFYQGDLTKDAMITLNFASFDNPRVVITMQPLQLDGGIAAIDINADMIVSAACQLVFEVQVNGNWIPLSSVNTQALIGLPPLLPLRAVFVGTSDIMPGLKLAGSQVLVSRPRTVFKHISTECVRVSTTTVRIQVRYENWNTANHTIACSLLVGAAFDTVETADVTETVVESDYAIHRTYTFNLAAAHDSFKIVFDGTTSSALDVFHVSERVDVEFA
ncbi:hypothetical protein [Hyphomicrobium sp. MC8b]|uniref:hypothetical protein n=1 Tax=Hyphomicrobium sp. MC8b TaxID=300273 RepID=UPI00391C8420